jgi:hypothetical protein
MLALSHSIQALIKNGAGDAGALSNVQRDEMLLSDGRPLKYVRFCLKQMQRRRSLVTTSNSEALTWRLILTVAEAQLANSPLFVSDLYYSTPSAKTTINSRINELVKRHIFSKHTDPTDGRRQNLRLAEPFQHNFDAYVSDNIKDLARVLK